MNENKIVFIICTNNDILLNECIIYIDRLFIPEGYEIDIITIRDAACMTEGYQAGMQSTDAKYKIYMHQDVFIINRYFLYDILTLFSESAYIGMIGMVGYSRVSVTGFMWHASLIGINSMYGIYNEYAQEKIETYRFSIEDGYSDVALIDGLMMITAYDLDWNTEKLRHWDFYDAYQSMHFLEEGYRIIVPHQKLPWFIHDDGKILSLYNYNTYRKMFMKDYSKFLGKNYAEIRQITQEKKKLDEF